MYWENIFFCLLLLLFCISPIIGLMNQNVFNIFLIFFSVVSDSFYGDMMNF